MFMASAAMGGVLAILLNTASPGLNLAPGAFALAAMAAVFGAASRSTFAFIIFAFEITQDYNAILPLMLVCVIADGVALFFMRDTIMTEKLARRGLRVPQEYEADVLRQVTVGSMMDPAPMTLASSLTVQQLADHIARGKRLMCATRRSLLLMNTAVYQALSRGAIYYGRWKQPLGNRFLSARPVRKRW